MGLWYCVVWCRVLLCGIVCSVVLLMYYAIVGVVYFGVWCSEVSCGSVVWCGIVSCSFVEGYIVGWGRGCSVGVVLLLRWSGVVS